MDKRASLPIWFSLSLAVVAAAAALTSWNLLRVMSAVRNAESSGLLPVGRGIAEANHPLLMALYIGTGCTLVANIAYVRSFKNASPPAWLAFAASVLTLVPVLVVWQAESLMLDALPFSRDGVVANATLIQRLLMITLGGGVLVPVLLFVGSTLRVPSRSTLKRRTTVASCLLVTAFILVAIAFHLRNAWINGLYRQL